MRITQSASTSKFIYFGYIIFTTFINKYKTSRQEHKKVTIHIPFGNRERERKDFSSTRSYY